MRTYLTAFCFALFPLFAPGEGETMEIGTNFWFLAPQWTGENPWIWEQSTDETIETSTFVPENPYTNGINPWNETFLEETSFYTVLRFMDWGKTNHSQLQAWSQRVLPDTPDNFGARTIAGSRAPLPGLAYEWMIDLCNRQGADLWMCVPHAADDDFVRNLAALIHEKLDASLKVYVEYSNEVWNFRSQQEYCKAMGQRLGFGSDFNAAMLYQAYRSAEIWKIFEDEFAGQGDRVVNVISGQSTNAGITRRHLDALADPEFNPTGVRAEAYAIAPYFGGNGLNGGDPQVFEKLREDIFERRPQGSNSAGGSSRIANVRAQFEVAQAHGISLIAYEGGQHIGRSAAGPNRDPRMYQLYIDYLDALAPYLDVFTHYTHAGKFGGGGAWGAKEVTGQDPAEAHKYRALRDWAARHSN